MFTVKPLTYEQLDMLARPKAPEAISYVLYDTLTLPAAGIASLVFFQQNNPDPTISNVNGGTLPAGYRFNIQSMGLDILREPTAGDGTTAGVITDITRIVKVNRGIVQFQKSQKDYGYLPLSFCHESGGATGFIAATLTAPANLQYGNNGVFDGGYFRDGDALIGSLEPFKATLQWRSPFTALAVDSPLRFWLRGVLYRPVN